MPSRMFFFVIDLYDSSSNVLMVVLLGNKILSWLSVPMYRFDCSDKKRPCLVCFPFSFWIVLGCQRMLRSVNAVFLFGDRSIPISQSSNLSFHILGLFPNIMLIVLLTVIFMSSAIVIHFSRSIFMSLTAMMSLTEVAAVTFEK